MVSMIETLMLQTVEERPDLRYRIQTLIRDVWPTYVTESTWPKGHPLPYDWMAIYDRWPHLQFGLCDGDGRNLVAEGNCLALAWDGDAEELPDEGWNWAMHQAAQDHRAGRAPTIACALSITLDPNRRGQNLSRNAVLAMRDLAQRAGYTRLIAPVRPTWKHRYPLTPIQEYIRWTTHDGLPFDPWLRVHVRLGARIVKPCARSMVMAGTVAEWEEWGNLPLPASGTYVVPGLLSTLQVDREADECVCVEPNVWIEHRLA
ncbi:MAG: GNAT family N-acetyltransferase [Caldilineaceae bacterium]|nr:GNAT family N-acetyltransferase [Caldilineaceae bacterium]